ncbi:hypothetical protein [Psychromonas ossibalaenae]|uniref:hypothetical protein n=1 Tax=Psychromonas ossibalaenae TaxID=444922 RepID=UPI00037A70C6|nr:hypothetical protein [Psychromonas ossibalaenae]
MKLYKLFLLGSLLAPSCYALDKLELYNDDWHGELKYRVVNGLIDDSEAQLYQTIDSLGSACDESQRKPTEQYFIKCISPNAYPMVSQMIEAHAQFLSEGDTLNMWARGVLIRAGFDTDKADLGYDFSKYYDQLNEKTDTLVSWSLAFNHAVAKYPKLSQFSIHGGVDEKKLRFSIENGGLYAEDSHMLFQFILLKLLAALQAPKALNVNSDAYIWSTVALKTKDTCQKSKKCYFLWQEGKSVYEIEKFLDKYNAKNN